MSTTREQVLAKREQLNSAVSNRAGVTVATLQQAFNTANSEWAQADADLCALARQTPAPTAQQLQDAKDLLAAKETARLDALDALTLAQRASGGYDGALTNVNGQYTSAVSGYVTP